MPCKLSVGIACRSAIACFCVNEGVAFFCTPGALTAAISWAVSQETSPLAVEIRCQFIILARNQIRCQFIILEPNPVSVHHSGTKSGVSSSFWNQIRCQFIILEPNPVSVHHSCPKRRTDTGLREKMNRHRITPRITRKDVLTPDYAPDYAKRCTDTGEPNPVSVHHSGNQIRCREPNPVSVHHSEEIRCQFIILARKDEPTPDYAKR